jgi:transketolase
VEQTATLRLMPNLDVWRPCDRVETLTAWAAAVERADGPTALVLSRQNLPDQPRTPGDAGGPARGGYVLHDPPAPVAVVIATGSEVELAMGAAARLAEEGVGVRVVSLPCVEVFDRQPDDYRAAVLPPGVPRVVVEAGATRGWYLHSAGGPVVGLDRFGESAPAAALFEHLGLTVDAVAAAVRREVERERSGADRQP